MRGVAEDYGLVDLELKTKAQKNKIFPILQSPGCVVYASMPKETPVSIQAHSKPDEACKTPACC